MQKASVQNRSFKVRRVVLIRVEGSGMGFNAALKGLAMAKLRNKSSAAARISHDAPARLSANTPAPVARISHDAAAIEAYQGRSSRPMPAPHGIRRNGRHRERASAPDRLFGQFRMVVSFGIGDALVQKPGV